MKNQVYLFANAFMAVIVLLSSGCASNDRPALSGHVVATLNVPYVEGIDDHQRSLDIYQSAESASNAPVHVYVHGGAWTRGDKSNLSPQQIEAYIDHGVVLVSINYRLGPAHRFPANSQDLVDASIWLKNNIDQFGGDPTRMVLSGHSAGAHLTALFAVGTPSAPAPNSDTFYRAVFSVDTALYDMTRDFEARGLVLRWLLKQKRLVFGEDKQAQALASPLHQIRPSRSYSDFYLYVTETRPEAVEQLWQFEKALSEHGHVVQAQVIPKLTHFQMKAALFTPGHRIFEDVMAAF
ncbi:MAG: alpha/beta hydrolase [Pseudomonadota bacterium]